MIVLLLAACLEPAPRVPAIFHGSPPDRPAHEAVVALHRVEGGQVSAGPFCTGTLIEDRVVLTAAHCVDAPGDLAVFVGDDPLAPGALRHHTYEVAEVLLHPAWSRAELHHDLALLRLYEAPGETRVRVPILPADLAPTDDDIGLPVDVVGFGRTEHGHLGRKLHVEVALAGLGCAALGCPYDGDPYTQLSYQQDEGGPCNGDSGGPLLLDRGGETFVAGITSFGESTCGVWGVSTRPDAYERFVGAFVRGEAATGRVVLNEVLPNPLGEDAGGEWVEIVNPGDAAVDLSHAALVDEAGHRYPLPWGLTVAPRSAEVIAGHLFLDNGGGEVLTLVDRGGGVLDTFAWDGDAKEGVSFNRLEDGVAGPVVRHDLLHWAVDDTSPGTRHEGWPY